MSDSDGPHRVSGRPFVAAIWLIMTPASAWAATPLGPGLMYQGRLEQHGTAVSGQKDMVFSLWDGAGDGAPPSGGTQIGSDQTVLDVDVDNGLFTVVLNAGGEFSADAFTSEKRWLQIAVDGTTLSPRQEITAAPAAQFAVESAQWKSAGNAIINANTGFVGINRDYAVGLEWFGVHAPVNTGYGGMYVTTEGAAAWPFYGYRAGGQSAWTYLDGGTGDWHVNVDGNRLTVTDEGNVGIRTTSPDYPLHVLGPASSQQTIHAENSNAVGAALFGHATHTSGDNCGVWGETPSSSGIAVNGYATAPSGGSIGGRFIAESPDSTGVIASGGHIGVFGTAFPVSGETWGGAFENYAPSGAGVLGIAKHLTGTASGVRGQTSSPSGVGVHGINTASSGTTYGIRGLVNSAAGYAGYFEGGRNYFQGRVGIGTSSPSNPLSVAGGADITGSVSIGITGADARLLVRGTTGEDAFRVRVEGSTKLLVKDNGGVGIGSNFGSLPTDGLRVQGNLGVGVDPAEKLHVAGAARFDGPVTIPATTRYLGISAPAFHPSSNTRIARVGGTPVVTRGLLTPDALCEGLADVSLPHGATITELRAHLVDNSGTENMVIELSRYGLSGSSELLATRTTSGASSSPRAFSTALSHVVDNQNHVYFVRVAWTDAPANTFSLRGVRITYAVDAPLP